MADLPSLASRLTTSEPSVGTMLKSMSPNVAEALGYTDLDFLFVDRQHGSPVTERLESIVRAADLTGLPVVTRVPRDDHSMTTSLLDLGVSGICIPQVESPETVREASSHVRYRDGRSLGTTTRAARFGAVPREAYVEHVDTELALLPMIETEAGVRNAGTIASMPEVTGVLVGPGDLAHSIGAGFGDDRHRRTIDGIFDAAAANDCPAGIFVSSVAELERYRPRASFLVYGKDLEMVTAHVTDVLESLDG